MSNKVQPIPEGYHTVTPYLIVKNAAKAIEFYKKAFSAEEKYRIDMGDLVGHAEIRIGDSTIMLADEMSGDEAKSPQALGGTPVTLMIYVKNVDAAAQQAVSAGIKIKKPVEDQFYGDRTGTFEDPYGHI